MASTGHEILRQDSDKFEQASIDEAYLDVTDIVKHDWSQRWPLHEDSKDPFMKKG